MSATVIHDVVIAGAGPVGLFLACDLRAAGVSVLVLEQLEDPRSPLKRLPFGMRGLLGSSLEAFDRRGLLEQVAPTGARRRRAGHFAGLIFDEGSVDPTRWTYRLPGPGQSVSSVEMEQLERTLAEHALALGVEIRRGRRVDGVEQAEDLVTVHAGPERLRARWLVGCDGGRSAVRTAAGFTSVGTEPELTGYSARVELADPEVLGMGPEHAFFPFVRGVGGVYTQWEPGALAILDFDGGAFDRSVPLTREHVQAVLRRVSGTDVTLAALHVASTWTDRARQATTYRRGRVLLAGDAAHIHSPLGGQGLNLGLGDAINLGWKLAATVRGDASEGLLDSYTAERHPVGAGVLDWTRAQVALMRPGSGPLEAVVADLIATRDGATYVAERTWGATRRYDLGGSHPLVGRSCPDLVAADGTRLAALLHGGSGVLWDLDERAPLRELRGRWGDRVRYLAGPAADGLGLSAVLVRPDGVVAWASDTTPLPEDVTRAAARWFGVQSVAPARCIAERTVSADSRGDSRARKSSR